MWTYTGYPLLLIVLSRLFKTELSYDHTYLPTVTLMIIAHNESKIIEKKIKNSLELNYPKEKLEIMVVDDGSDDGMQNIVKKYADVVKYVKQKIRMGKASAINYGVKDAFGEIIVTTDANAMLEKESLRKATCYFADEKVGAVSGRVITISKNKNDIEEGESAFWNIEKLIRTKESDLDSVIGLHGAFSAIRKNLVKFSSTNLTEDFEVSLQIRKQGYKIVYGNMSLHKLAPSNIIDVMTQKRRHLIGTIQTLREHKEMLFNPAYGWYGVLILPSHKLLQVLSPFFLILLPTSSYMYYLITQSVFAISLLYMQLFGLLYVVTSIVIVSFKPNCKYSSLILPKYFLILQLTILSAWKNYLTGDYQVTWEKIESSREL